MISPSKLYLIFLFITKPYVERRQTAKISPGNVVGVKAGRSFLLDDTNVVSLSFPLPSASSCNNHPNYENGQKSIVDGCLDEM
jgi:hypothetical protein